MKPNKKDRHDPWIFPDLQETDEETKRRMFVEAMRIVLRELMETHTYKFDGVIRQQQRGGTNNYERD